MNTTLSLTDKFTIVGSMIGTAATVIAFTWTLHRAHIEDMNATKEWHREDTKNWEDWKKQSDERWLVMYEKLHIVDKDLAKFRAKSF